MADAPWLTIVGIGEDGAAGLSAPARAALATAEVVTGAPRHLALLGPVTAPVVPWPVPFADGTAWLAGQRGRRVVMLVSGDPFWFGAGSVVTRGLSAGEWVAHPALSTFALAAARLGWPIEDTACLGLHAAPVSRLRPVMARGRRALVTLRDGAAIGEVARYLCAQGFGASHLHVLEALGGPRERLRDAPAARLACDDIAHPVALGIVFDGDAALPCVAGRDDSWFDHDGQISKQPIRALTLSALAPRAGEMLWDVGAGSGSIAIEWLLADRSNRALAFERDPVRAARARGNALALGVDRLRVIAGDAPDVLDRQPLPDAVFIGGGLSDALLAWLCERLNRGTRLVANAVTLESEALLVRWQQARGGGLMRVELAEAAPIGARRGWRARYPVVQWRAVI